MRFFASLKGFRDFLGFFRESLKFFSNLCDSQRFLSYFLDIFSRFFGNWSNYMSKLFYLHDYWLAIDSCWRRNRKVSTVRTVWRWASSCSTGQKRISAASSGCRWPIYRCRSKTSAWKTESYSTSKSLTILLKRVSWIEICFEGFIQLMELLKWGWIF